MKRPRSVFVHIIGDTPDDTAVVIETSDGKKSVEIDSELHLEEAIGVASRFAEVLGVRIVNEVRVHSDCPGCRCKP